MSDLIKREDAIKAVEECLKLLARPRYTVKTAIEAIPSVDIPHSDDWGKYSDKLWRNAYERGKADRPQEWIPCSERLPSEQGQYLVTFPLCNGEPWVYILSFNKGKFYETDDEWGDVEYDDVTAWMPLPKPWKGADDRGKDYKGEYVLDDLKYEAPSIDIVRCRECRYWHSGECWGIPYRGDYDTSIDTKADDFCSYGCRKEE